MNDRSADQSAHRPFRNSQPGTGGGQNRRHSPGRPATPRTIQIGATNYTVLEQLSLPSRGRWKVRVPQPRPRDTFFTVLDLPDSREAMQLKNSLYRLPENTWGLPRLVDWRRQCGRLLLVLPWFQGTDLERYFERLKSPKSLPPSPWEAVRRVRSLAHGLGILHRTCRVVHGDIKPANLILPKDPGSLFLIDYGSSWQIESTLDRAVGDGANPFYSAPEVFLNERRVDERADQFSAGVVLFQMLTLKLPYDSLGGKAGHPEHRPLVESKYTPPSKLMSNANELPKAIRCDLDEVVTTALRLDASGRFPSTLAFSEALDGLWVRLNQAKHSSESDLKPPWWTRFL